MRNGNYTLVIAPDNYPGKKYRGRYIYEHHLVWWQNTNILVPEGYMIHHRNHKHRDNGFKNLEMINKGSHTSLHNKRGAEKIALNCAYCKKPFVRDKRNAQCKINMKQERFYCCRSHQVSHQQIMLKEKKKRISDYYENHIYTA